MMNETWCASRDDSQLIAGNSPRHCSGSVHDNGCHSLHNIQEAVRGSEKSILELPFLQYTDNQYLSQDAHEAAPLPVIAAEEPTLQYQEEAVCIESVGGGSGVSPAAPLRLLVVSSKIRNSNAFRTAILPNIVFVQYKYESNSLDLLQSLIINTLKTRKVESVAMVMSCVGSSLQITGKDEALLNKDTIAEIPLQGFFTTLKEIYLEGDNSRLDFLACNAMSYIYTDSMMLVKELEKLLKIPVGMFRDILGTDSGQKNTEGSTKNLSTCIGELYFKLDRLKGWTRQQQSMAGFEKIQTVGKGAYGAAVLYRKKDDDSLVILKEINMHDLNAAERQLALNEVSILAMLVHPNIISYYDSFEEDGVLMIEIEYADGGTLAQCLSQRDKPLEEREILLMFQQIVSAIKHIHEQNILHRDLKTANIFLTKEGVVKVGDFGISKMMSSANKGANTVLGTPYYISPEMCEGKPYNDKSDIWALGCILYEMACLQKTFEGSNLPALVNKIMKGQFAPVKGNYSQELKDLIMDMLKQDPDQRPSSHEILYTRIPELMQKYEESLSDDESSQQNSLSENRSKKKTRSVLYYFECCSASITPVDLPSKIKIIHAATGEDHVIVISNEKRVYSWGKGSRGQLGHDNTEDKDKPTMVEALTGKSISRAYCGDGFSVFASDNGIVLTCGDGSSGCLGHGDWKNTNRPRLIETLLSIDVIAVACGKKHVVVVGSEGEVFSWGCGADGRLGLGNDDDQCIPTEVLIDEKALIRDVRCGLDGTMFITDVGSVYACGNNVDNKLGLNNRFGFIMAMKNIFTKTEVEGQKVPTPVKAIKGVLDISMGPSHTAVMVKPGHIYTFGRNCDGQLGAGNVKQISGYVEVKAMLDKTVNRVQCGSHFSVASTEDNELYYWGLRFKNPTFVEDNDSHSSTNGSLVNAGDLRVESVTPRKSGHSRQSSSSSISELTHDKGGKSHSRQASLTDNSYIQKDKENMLRRDSGNHSRHASSVDLKRETGSQNKLASTSSLGDNGKELASKKDSGNNSSQASSTDLRKENGSQTKLASSSNVREITQKDKRTHSRQTSLTSVSSVVSNKDPIRDEGIEGDSRPSPAHQRQTSLDSALSASLTDSGFQTNENKPGFRPLSSARRRTASASSKENKEKEKEEISTDDAEIIYPPKHLLKIMKNSAEQLTISSFYCHGENLFIQMETTAPPPKRKSRKKRGIRKRYSGNTLNVPQEDKALYPVSSQEGVDEYSSEASEMDSHGPVPDWIKQELALTENELNDGNEADDTSDHSDDEIRNGLVDASMSSIQINKELTKGKSADDQSKKDGKLSKDFSNSSKFVDQAFGKVEVHQVRSLAYNSTESELDLPSDGSSKENEPKENKSGSKNKSDVSSGRKVSSLPSKNRLPPGPPVASKNKVPSRNRAQGEDVGWKEQLAARGFVSDVTVKRKQEALKNELEITRGEKRRAQEKIKILEEEHKIQTELLKREVEKKAKEREAALEVEISSLRKQICDQKSQMMDHQKLVLALQSDLKKVQARADRDSKVCALQ